MSRRPGELLAGRPAWLLLAALVATLLAVGSVHGHPRPQAERISYLESVIRCPSCVDLTIAQSDSQPARYLRQEVVIWVGAGRSDSWIEQQVTARYGGSALLVPAGSGIGELAWALPIAAVVLAGGALAWFLIRRRPAPEHPSPEDEGLVAAALAGRREEWRR